jgi:cytoskeleton protein RodZ
MMKPTISKNQDKTSENEAVEQSNDFGSALAEARKARSFTEAEISEHIKIPEHIVTAIENNDVASLPAVTYTQGYIRSYAKFLELPVDDLLQKYNRAVPHQLASELKPRSSLPNEANSQSPLVKLLTKVLILAGLATLGYGIFQYYQEKAGDMGSERETREQRFTGNSLDSPGTLPDFRSPDRAVSSDDTTAGGVSADGDSRPLSIKQNARLSEDGELILTGNETTLGVDDSVDVSTASTDESVATAETVEVVEQNSTPLKIDVIEVYAEQGTWLEVYDVDKNRLFYNMLQAGSSKLLSGQAPFRIKLGNARTTQVSVNNTPVDMTPYIRANNTVIITVSTDNKNVIFH